MISVWKMYIRLLRGFSVIPLNKLHFHHPKMFCMCLYRRFSEGCRACDEDLLRSHLSDYEWTPAAGNEHLRLIHTERAAGAWTGGAGVCAAVSVWMQVQLTFWERKMTTARQHSPLITEWLWFINASLPLYCPLTALTMQIYHLWD